MKDIPEIDLSRMTQLPKCAVICRTEEEAAAFYFNCKQQLADYTKWWDLDNIFRIWEVYQKKTGFTLFVSYDTPRSMSYCNEEWFRSSGYEVIEFSDIAESADIDESDKSVDVLFGGIV